MRTSSLIAAIMASVTFAMPLDSINQGATARLLHPAVTALTDTTTALSNVVPEIRAFDGKSEWDARKLEIDAINAVNMMNNATNLLVTQPDVDYLTALQFVPVVPALFTGAYSLVNALNEKKAQLQSTTDLARRALNILDATNTGAQALVAAVNAKFPSAITFILKGLDDDIVAKMQKARDEYTYIGNSTATAIPVYAPPAPFYPQQQQQQQQQQQPASYPAYPAYQQGRPQQQQQQGRPQQQGQPQYQQIPPQYPAYQSAQPQAIPAWQPAQVPAQDQPQYPAYQPAGMEPPRL